MIFKILSRFLLLIGTRTNKFEDVSIMLFCVLICSVRVTGQSYIDKHNFGYILQKEMDINLMTAEAKLVFYYELPPRVINVDMTNINCSTFEITHDILTCSSLLPILVRFRQLKV